MKDIKQTYLIKAPLSKVWQALTSQEVMEQWGAGPAKMDTTAGGRFSLWGGDIHGTNTKVVPEKVLAQDWYGHDHPERMYQVIFSFSANGEATVVYLRHDGVPDDEAKDTWQFSLKSYCSLY